MTWCRSPTCGPPGTEAVPGRRPVHDLAVPDHRQLRQPTSSAGARGTATRSSTRTPAWSTSGRPRSRAVLADAAELRDRLKGALAELPPRLRAVVVLRDVYDLPHEAIAAELGISESAAKVRLHRARRKLREQLFPVRDERDDEEADAHAV